jgi:deoxyribose-phosphate aldolase
MKNYTRKEVAAAIDHAVLKPNMTVDDVRRHAEMCAREQVASICVRPTDIPTAYDVLMGTGVKLSCVLSFPHGADSISIKLRQAQRAMIDEVDEIDMVMNIGRFLSGHYDYIEDEISTVVTHAHKEDVIVKVILETAYLTLDQVAIACELACNAGADFVKTSTGFAPTNATPEVVDVMLRTVGTRAKVKASGGIRDWNTAVAYLRQGVHRLGIGATEEVLAGCPEQ